MANEIVASTAGSWTKYRRLKANERDELDRKHGLNRYAQPDVGGGLTIASGGRDYANVATWNFHWAGVVMSTGTDHVTLENYAVGDATVQNTEWKFQMYGPPAKAGQTFHDQHKATREHGRMPSTMAVGSR